MCDFGQMYNYFFNIQLFEVDFFCFCSAKWTLFCLFLGRNMFNFKEKGVIKASICICIMKKILFLLCMLFGMSSCSSKENERPIDNRTVSELNISRFMGKWYEIARYEHRFEKDMTHVSATYTLKEDGKIEVLNEGYKNGEAKQIKGRAKQPDAADPGKLKVSFFLWFYSDYYILEVGVDYDYVLVGSSTDKYLWIMYREKQIPQQLLDELLEKLRARGYDTERLLFVNQK